jgi:hypothetical protein
VSCSSSELLRAAEPVAITVADAVVQHTVDAPGDCRKRGEGAAAVTAM